MKRSCPKCGSGNISFTIYDRTQLISCNECSYDESEDLEVYPEDRAIQREKQRHSPYKKGGHGRAGKAGPPKRKKPKR